MNVEIVEMNAQDARRQYVEYRRAVKRHRERRAAELEAKIAALGEEAARDRIKRQQLEREDDELRRAYLELSRGARLINLVQAIEQAGVNDQHLPRLAIARSDAQHVWYDGSPSRAEGCVEYRVVSNGWRVAARDRVLVPARALPITARSWAARRDAGLANTSSIGRAVVPSVPAHLRPDDLSAYYTLWEVERWDLTPPSDPILLRHVVGQTYAVVAQWDLTPLEKMVLAGRPGPS